MNKPNLFETKSIYLAAWLKFHEIPFSHTENDKDGKVHFFFEDFEKASKLTQTFYDSNSMIKQYIDTLQEIKKIANQTKEQKEEFPE